MKFNNTKSSNGSRSNNSSKQQKKPAAQGSRVKEQIDPGEIEGMWIMCFTSDCITSLCDLTKLAKDSRVASILNSMQNRAQLKMLLQHETAKARKNAAKLIGVLSDKADCEALEKALKEETTLFVVPSILLALGNCGTEKSGEAIKSYLSALPEPQLEQQKHYAEIKEAANAALSRLTKHVKRTFTGFKSPIEIILRAPFDCGDLLAAEASLKGIKGELIGDDFAITTMDIMPLFALRTFDEILIPLGDAPLPPLNLTKIALSEWSGHLVPIANRFAELLSDCLTPAPYPYRVELRGVPHNERSALIHALCAAIDSPVLANSPSAYDAQLRLDIIGSSTKAYAQLCVPQDDRFAYREKAISASITPVNAALIMQLALPFMKEGARVIDPCCGSGTLLIERGLIKPIKEGIGVDIDPNALTAARQNIKNSALNIEAIGGDLIAFKPKAPFDELYANLPFGTRVGTADANAKLYKSLIGRLSEYVVKGGIAVLYTTQRAPLIRLLERTNLKIIAQKRMEAGGLNPWAIIVKI